MGHLKKVDWENLAKNLQEALSKEMKDNEFKGKYIEALNNRIEHLEEQLSDDVLGSVRGRSDNCAVIRYLENRLFEEIQKNRARDEELPF